MNHIVEKVNADRAFFNDLGNIYAADSSVRVVDETIEGVDCYWFEPGQVEEGNLLIYLHGGAFVLGSIRSHRPMVSHIASALSARVLFIDYALAPERPFPHGLNDVLRVYRAISEKHPHAEISLFGDSAGGGLAVSFIKAAASEEMKMPSCVVLISPWLNLRCNTESHETRKGLDRVLSKDVLSEYANHYAGNRWNEADPSQLSFRRFPPLFILVGSNEILFDDSHTFYGKIRALQPETRMKEYMNEGHVWLMTDINSAGSQTALSDIRQFMDEIEGKGG